ncbi:MAG TPA: DUF3124 domain-containing protein [Candidatus Sulfobium mesophilum]|nr:DUF3124 domain-containing protein [Candidatus Sulfobium mesophilum]
MINRAAVILATIILVCSLANNAFSEPAKKQTQTIYVSAYPHVFMGPRGTVFDLGITLMIRNTDFKSPITITSVDYYDTQGKLTKKYLSSPLSINPMASKEIHITEKDAGGGIGSNFIVRWKAEKEVNVPAIEAVMIGGKGGHAISFISPGKEISE